MSEDAVSSAEDACWVCGHGEADHRLDPIRCQLCPPEWAHLKSPGWHRFRQVQTIPALDGWKEQA